jgi:L-threonylcarbamoyladenylate synthase
VSGASGAGRPSDNADAGGPLDAADAAALQECLASGGVAVFPADTVYGLACDPRSRSAFERMYEMKGRPAAKPAAVMWFSLSAAADELARLSPRTREAAQRLLPGPVTLLLANPQRRFPLACEPDGDGSGPPAPLGLRVPAWPPRLAALELVQAPALQSSANLSGQAPARRLSDVPRQIRDAADLVIDGGDLPGLASTVIDLQRFELDGRLAIVREGALSEAQVHAALTA